MSDLNAKVIKYLDEIHQISIGGLQLVLRHFFGHFVVVDHVVVMLPGSVRRQVGVVGGGGVGHGLGAPRVQVAEVIA